jgi:diguanylate cyclase (GGDEF)-like protein
MSFPDVATLRLCSTLASTAFGFVFAVLWLRNRNATHFGLWALSSLIYGLGMLVFALAPDAPRIAVVLFGLLAFSNMLPLAGVYAMEHKRVVRAWMAIPIFSAVAGHVLPVLLVDAGSIAARGEWQAVGDAVGLAIGIGVPGWALAFGQGARASAGRRLAGAAMLCYLPAYMFSIVGEFWALPGKELVALTAMLSDQILLGILNLGLLAIPVEQVQRQLRDAALKDALTGCWNRAGLTFLTSSYFLPRAAVLALDVDCFKQINDRFGHAAGDEVLAFLGREARLLGAAFDAEVIRQGGDEFIVVLPPGVGEAEHYAALLQDRLATHTALDSPWSVSLGIAMVRGNDASLDDAIARADIALYQAKESSRGQRSLRGTPGIAPLLTLAS